MSDDRPPLEVRIDRLVLPAAAKGDAGRFTASLEQALRHGWAGGMPGSESKADRVARRILAKAEAGK
jgi:hypothetical protein